MCVASETELKQYLEQAGSLTQGQRGVDHIPKASRGTKLTVRQHVVLRCRVECLCGYTSVDVAKSVASMKKTLQLLHAGTAKEQQFVARVSKQLEDIMHLTSLEGREFVARVDVEVARVKELGGQSTPDTNSMWTS